LRRAGPQVRILLPPAASHTNFEGQRTQALIGCYQIASWLAGQGRDGFVDRRVVMEGSKHHGDPEGKVAAALIAWFNNGDARPYLR
jgi:hypothetical protein